jgi:hypothetical protein
MTTTTQTTQHTLDELARYINRVITENSDRVNPRNEDNDACLYFDPETLSRCLIGQALFEMTGLDVPPFFEENGIDSLLQYDVFCDFFGLPYETHLSDTDLYCGVTQAQTYADEGVYWGDISPIII